MNWLFPSVIIEVYQFSAFVDSSFFLVMCRALIVCSMCRLTFVNRNVITNHLVKKYNRLFHNECCWQMSRTNQKFQMLKVMRNSNSFFWHEGMTFDVAAESVQISQQQASAIDATLFELQVFSRQFLAYNLLILLWLLGLLVWFAICLRFCSALIQN